MSLRFIHARVDALDPKYYFNQFNADGSVGVVRVPNCGTYPKRITDDQSDPNFAYCMPDHPGGYVYLKHIVEPLIPVHPESPPLLHILRFWTSFSLLAIDSELSAEYSYYTPSYRISDPLSHLTVGWIELDPEWRSNHPTSYLGEFVVISVNSVSSGRYPSPWMLWFSSAVRNY